MERGTATLLAVMMSAYLREKYTRYVIADIEGRRERNVRWHELVALCEIFEVPLWELVLPPEGTVIETAMPLHGPAISRSGRVELDHPDITFFDLEPAGRNDLSGLLFSLDAEILTAEGLTNFRSEMERKRGEQIDAVVAEARAAYEKLAAVLAEPKES